MSGILNLAKKNFLKKFMEITKVKKMILKLKILQ